MTLSPLTLFWGGNFLKRCVILCIFVVLSILCCSVCLAEEYDDSIELNVLRLDYAGLEPIFNSQINEYYLRVDGAINNLDIIAIPSNAESTVNVTGNTGLKFGMNIVTIEIVSYNGNKNQYYIYVTKTDSPELANANLENLAVKQGSLYPEFDPSVTDYVLEVSYSSYNLDILAIPEAVNSKIDIIGNSELEIGNNFVEIMVTAENNVTFKKYKISVHRRSAEEESKFLEEKNVEAKRLQSILNSEQIGNRSLNFSVSDNKNVGILVFLVVTLICWILVLIIKKFSKKI